MIKAGDYVKIKYDIEENRDDSLNCGVTEEMVEQAGKIYQVRSVKENGGLVLVDNFALWSPELVQQIYMAEEENILPLWTKYDVAGVAKNLGYELNGCELNKITDKIKKELTIPVEVYIEDFLETNCEEILELSEIARELGFLTEDYGFIKKKEEEGFEFWRKIEQVSFGIAVARGTRTKFFFSIEIENKEGARWELSISTNDFKAITQTLIDFFDTPNPLCDFKSFDEFYVANKDRV